jgi:hypothetical protein
MLVYEPLTAFLKAKAEDEVPMTFDQIEQVIVRKLPPSALKEGNAWWSNNPARHSQAVAWLGAGFEAVSVDRRARTVVFRRVRQAVKGMADEARPFRRPEGLVNGRHPAIGALKGMTWIEPGYDLTKPVLDEDWEAAFDKKWDALLK